MKTCIAHSTNPNANEAVNEIVAKFKSIPNIKAIIFFASTSYNGEVVAPLQDAFPDVKVFGCSSASEITNEGMFQNSLIATAFTDEIFEDIALQVVENNPIDNPVDITHQIDAFQTYYNTPLFQLDKKQFLGLIFAVDNVAEEHIYDELSDRTSVLFTGATASSTDQKFNAAVYANGKIYANHSAVIALIKTRVPFHVEKIQAAKQIDLKSKIGKIDYKTRALKEFDNGLIPVQIFSKLYNCSEQECLDATIFQTIKFPLGINIDGDSFLRTILGFNPDGSCNLACNILEGTEVDFYKATSLLETTKIQMAEIKQKHPNISFILKFNCLSRYFELVAEKDDLSSEYMKNWDGIETIGFNANGEYYIGKVNQTSTMLIFE